MAFFPLKKFTLTDCENGLDSRGNSWLAGILVGSWVRFCCVTDDFIWCISGASTLGSWGILWLRTFIKAGAAGTASSGGQEGKASFHSGQPRPVQWMSRIRLGSLTWMLTNPFLSRIFCLWVSLRFQYIATVAKVSPDFLRPPSQALFFESKAPCQWLWGERASEREVLSPVLPWRKSELLLCMAVSCLFKPL